MQVRAAARELEELDASRAKSQQTDDADALTLRIEGQLVLASTIQTVLAEAESATAEHRSATAAALFAAQRKSEELQTQTQAACARTHKLSKALEAEKEKGNSLRELLDDAEARNKELAEQIVDLEMQLRTKSEELDLMFKTNEARRYEQRKAAEQETEKRGELQDKVTLL